MTSLLVPEGFQPVGKTAHDGEESAFGLIRSSIGEDALLVCGPAASGFEGEPTADGKRCPLSPEAARKLAGCLPWLRPRQFPTGEPSFGFGDRLGLATPGHIRSFVGHEVFPVLAQQSVRENARTGRTFATVLADAVFAVLREGFQGGFGADADHLKEITDAEEAARLGYTLFTCDPGDLLVDPSSLGEDEIKRRFSALDRQGDLKRRYVETTFAVDSTLVLHFTENDLSRTAVKYANALDRAVAMYEAIGEIRGDAFDYEVSVDETDDPTTPLEHLYVALELKRRGVRVASLAPRFVGAIEKGVDWRGDRAEFGRQLERHARIARSVGEYRLSLHSGSDKYSIYPDLVRATGGNCHIKTAGTSYLVALEVIATHAPALFREILALAKVAFANDSATYHISADPERVPDPENVPDADLRQIVERHDGRQLLHVTFGTIVRGPLRDDFRNVLVENEQAHFEALAHHMRRHLDAMEGRADG